MAQYIEDQGGLPLVKQSRKLMTGLAVDFSNAPSVALPGATTIAGTGAITSTSATAFTVAAAGTNYGLQVDESTSSAATGIKIKAAAAGGGLAITTISSGTPENLTIDAKGSGTVTINGTATGAVNIGTASNSLQVNSIIIPAYELLTDNQNQVAAASYAVSHSIFVNDNVSGTYKIVSCSESHGTASSSGTLQVEVATGTQAIGSGTNQLTGTMSLAGTANTTVNGTIIGSPTTIAAGNRINLIFAGTVTNLANCTISVALQRLS